MSGIASIATRVKPAVCHQLERVLAHAAARIPLYARYWQEMGVDPQRLSLRTPSDLARFPVIDRSRFEQSSSDQIRDRRWPRRLLHWERSGGSTGTPLGIPLDPITYARRQFRFLGALIECGYRPGDRFLMLTTRPTGRHPTLPNCFCADIRSPPQTLLRIYRQFRPRLLYGPLNSLLLLGEVMEVSSERTDHPAVLVATAEELTDSQRRRLRAVFGIDPADFYGLSEAGLVAWRPPSARHYRPADRDLYLEFLPVPGDSSLERLVITDRHAGACMPLVRYETGDLVQREDGSEERLLFGFRGRSVDCLRKADGSPVSPYRVTLLLEDVAGLRRYQVVQRGDLAIDVYLWATETMPDGAFEGVRSAVEQLMDGSVTVRVRAGAPDSAAGLRKFRPVRSEAGDGACAY